MTSPTSLDQILDHHGAGTIGAKLYSNAARLWRSAAPRQMVLREKQ